MKKYFSISKIKSLVVPCLPCSTYIICVGKTVQGPEAVKGAWQGNQSPVGRSW